MPKKPANLVSPSRIQRFRLGTGDKKRTVANCIVPSSKEPTTPPITELLGGQAKCFPAVITIVSTLVFPHAIRFTVLVWHHRSQAGKIERTLGTRSRGPITLKTYGWVDHHSMHEFSAAGITRHTKKEKHWVRQKARRSNGAQQFRKRPCLIFLFSDGKIGLTEMVNGRPGNVTQGG